MALRLFSLLLSTMWLCVVPGDSPPTPEHPVALPITSWKGKRALFVGAHPDDIEAASGGTVRLLVEQGTEVAYAVFTNGDKGCSNAKCQNFTSAQIAALRQQEQENAATVSGVPWSNVFMFDFEDGLLVSYPVTQTAVKLVSVIRKFQPHVIFSWFLYPNLLMQPHLGWDDLGYHPDHQETGRLTMYCKRAAADGRMFPTAGPAWNTPQMYLWEFLSPVYFADVGTVLTNKGEAFAAHASQCQSSKFCEQLIHDLGARVANHTVGFKGSYAEGFVPFY